MLFLVPCATIAGCDDYNEIAAWGALNVGFLRRYSEYFFGAPKEDWLRVVLNRIDPALFEACFLSWAAALRPEGRDLIALDGKTLPGPRREIHQNRPQSRRMEPRIPGIHHRTQSRVNLDSLQGLGVPPIAMRTPSR